MKKRDRSLKIVCIIFLLFFVVQISAERVGKLFYSGSPEEFKGAVMTVPSTVVALADEVYIGSPDTLLVKSSASSLFFIIDNSGSMYNFDSKITPVDSSKIDKTNDQWIHSVKYAKDPGGNRFNVVQDLLDTLSDSSRFAGVEVGVAVFQSLLSFHDTLPFTETLKEYDHSGAYLPLMKLSEEYDGKKGRTILKEYLECDYETYENSFMVGEGNYWWTSGTEEVTAEIASLKAPLFIDSLGDTVEAGTNINISMLALKEAMKGSSYTNENQYCIFLSDGEANVWYPETTDTAFMHYDSIPTTFTVFFSDSGEVPQTLSTFNENVKGQDYFSSSNKNSALWAYENTSHEDLMKFLMENVISLFDQTFFTTPVGITINGYTYTVDWDGKKLLLNDLIPIASDTTSLSYDLALMKVHDSLTLEGDTIVIEEEDTLSFAYDVIIDATLQDVDSTFSISYWDRSIVVTDAGNEISEITEKDQALQLEFHFDPLDAGYTYSRCSISVHNNQSGGLADTVALELTKVEGENRFIASLPYNLLDGDAIQGDEVLQLFNEDLLTFTFRNSEEVTLPLDLLTYTLPVDIIRNEVTIKAAAYFDKDADGYVDLLQLQYEGDSFDVGKEELFSAVSLPENVAMKSVDISTDTIDIALTYSGTGFKTSVDAFDTIHLQDSMNNGKGTILLPFSLYIADSMAPVLTKASMIDSMIVGKRDELTLHFSEPVKSVDGDEPFRFKAGADNKTYSAALSEIESTDTIMIFEVLSVIDKEKIEAGDSLRISIQNGISVSDSLDNRQGNASNRIVPIDLKEINEYMELHRAVYFDSDANGFVDSMNIYFKGDYLSGNEKSLIDALSIAEARDLTVDKLSISDGYFQVQLIEDKLKTIVTDEDVIIVKDDVHLPNGAILTSDTIAIEDSIAPVILEASLVDSAKSSSEDLLRVVFSETVASHSEEQPFRGVCKSTGEAFGLLLTQKELDDNRAVYRVEELIDKGHIIDGDSLYIRVSADTPIGDDLGNEQHNRDNLRQPIRVTFIAEPLTFEFIATLWTEEGYMLSDEITALEGFDQLQSGLSIDEKGTCKESMVIVVQPEEKEHLYSSDSLAGSIRIMDQVGNVVVEELPLLFDREHAQLVTVWNGRNRLNRIVGTGTYLALAEIRVFRKGSGGLVPTEHLRIKETIGVKSKLSIIDNK